MLQDSVTERSGKRLCFSNGRVLDLVVVERVGAIWRVRDESGPMLGLKLLVGPRWREFHCLRRRGPAGGRDRRGAGMQFTPAILYINNVCFFLRIDGF